MCLGEPTGISCYSIAVGLYTFVTFLRRLWSPYIPIAPASVPLRLIALYLLLHRPLPATGTDLTMANVVKKPIIAIAGATGDLGSHLVDAFLSEAALVNTYERLVLLVRKVNDKTREWEAIGTGAVKVHVYSEALGDDGEISEKGLAELLDQEGVQVLVNT